MGNFLTLRNQVFDTDRHPHPMILGEFFQAEQGSSRGHTGNRAASGGPLVPQVLRPELGDVSADVSHPGDCPGLRSGSPKAQGS